MAKQEMVRIKTDILGISELKWMGMGELNSNSHYIYYCGQESHRIPLRKQSNPHNHQKSETQYLGATSKMTE